MASSGSANKYPRVEVTWLDHAKTQDDAKDLKPIVRHTLGWLVKDKDTYICVAMDLSKSGHEYGFCIVKKLILEMGRL